MSDPTTSVVKCQCGVKLRVPPNAAGKRIRCPKCGYRVEIPADGAPAAPVIVSATQPAMAAAGSVRAAPSARPAVPPPPPADEGDSLLSDFMQSEAAAATSAGPDLASKQKACPGCKAAMAQDATVCVMCGHDLKARPAATAAPSTGKKAKEAAVGAAKSGGRFAVGCLLSIAGALIGAAIWFVVGKATGKDFGAIALLVGVLAGGGMAYGYRTGSALAGWVAAGTTVGGVILAKIMLAAFVLYGMFTGNTGDIDEQREFVKMRMLEDRFAQQQMWSPDQRSEKEEEYTEAIESEVDAMSPQEVRAQWEKYSASGTGFRAEIGRYRVAEHRAQRRAREAGVPLDGSAYEAFHNEESYLTYSLSSAELDQKVAELDAWEAGGEYADAQHVRDRLIYERAEPACDKEMENFNWDGGVAQYELALASTWKKHYEAAAADVDAMAPEARLEELKRIDADQESAEAAEREELLKDLRDNVSGGAVALGIGALIVIFFVGVVGIFGTIFMIIASVTAFRIASNGLT